MGILIVIKKKKMYGLGIFTTFFIYVFYDLSKLIGLNISSLVLYILFFIATVSALIAVIGIYKDKHNITSSNKKTRDKKK